jgi:hypothetical protein
MCCVLIMDFVTVILARKKEGVDCYFNTKCCCCCCCFRVRATNTKYRSELEASYAKGLAKLASKLLKTTGELQGPHGTVTAGWSAVAMKMESEAELHK